jgi:hypothetical protein
MRRECHRLLIGRCRSTGTPLAKDGSRPHVVDEQCPAGRDDRLGVQPLLTAAQRQRDVRGRQAGSGQFGARHRPRAAVCGTGGIKIASRGLTTPAGRAPTSSGPTCRPNPAGEHPAADHRRSAASTRPPTPAGRATSGPRIPSAPAPSPPFEAGTPAELVRPAGRLHCGWLVPGEGGQHAPRDDCVHTVTPVKTDF